MMNHLAIICPVFREEETVRLFHGRLAAVLDALSDRYACRVLYVVDPSPDRTEAVLSSLVASDPRVEILVMSRRFGHQAALVAGIDHSQGDATVMLDSDLQHPPELIIELLRHWENGADIVQMIRRDGKETSWLKRSTSRWFYSAFLKVCAVELPAGAADYRLLSRRVTKVFRDEMREHNPFLRGLVSWVGYKIVYVPFAPSKRERGESKYHLFTLINFALNGICSLSKMPLRLCIGAGFVMALVSSLLGIAQVLLYAVGNVDVPGWASLFAAVSFIGSIQLIFLGVQGEYISLIFDEVKGRPRYLVDRHYRQPAPQSQGESSEKMIEKTVGTT